MKIKLKVYRLYLVLNVKQEIKVFFRIIIFTVYLCIAPFSLSKPPNKGSGIKLKHKINSLGGNEKKKINKNKISLINFSPTCLHGSTIGIIFIFQQLFSYDQIKFTFYCQQFSASSRQQCHFLLLVFLFSLLPLSFWFLNCCCSFNCIACFKNN